jgi:putative DNA primase/helicase
VSQDTLAAFIEECCVVGPLFEVGAGALYDTYQRWAGKSAAMSQTAFGRRLDELGHTKRRATGGRIVRCGVGLIDGSEQ